MKNIFMKYYYVTFLSAARGDCHSEWKLVLNVFCWSVYCFQSKRM